MMTLVPSMSAIPVLMGTDTDVGDATETPVVFPRRLPAPLATPEGVAAATFVIKPKEGVLSATGWDCILVVELERAIVSLSVLNIPI